MVICWEILFYVSISRFSYIQQLVLSVWSVHVVPIYVRVLSGYSGFLSLSESVHVRLIGHSKLTFGVCVCV